MTPFKLPFNFTVAPPPGCTLSERFHEFLSSVILLPTGKTRKIAIGVSVGAVVLIALVISIVCFVRRRKARALSYQLTTANARNASSVTTTATRNDVRNTSSVTTPLTRANAGNTGHVTAMETRNIATDTSLAATRAIRTVPHGTQTSPPPPQATGQHSVNRSPSMNSVSLQTIPSGPPPAYPGTQEWLKFRNIPLRDNPFHGIKSPSRLSLK